MHRGDIPPVRGNPENHYYPPDVPQLLYRSHKCHILLNSYNNCPEDNTNGLSLSIIHSPISGVCFLDEHAQCIFLPVEIEP